MADVTWFRTPADDDPGTLNACYNALDLHVIRGSADEVALTVAEGPRTFAHLLTDVAACAGVLRAFGVGVGDDVALGRLPGPTAVVGALAVARVGGVAAYDDPAGATVRLHATEAGVVFGVDGEDLPWDVAMRAGRTDPAGCADVPGDAVLARHGADTLSVLAALGASDDHDLSAPPGLTLAEVGGLTFWWSDAPEASS
ncbi:MAG: hypothetical protein ACKOVB_20815 [Terrabacter sp.]